MPADLVVVVGATGGVGASTIAALLAAERARAGAATALVDLAGRGGVEVLLGIEGQPGVRWADLADVRAPIEAAGLRGALPRWRRVEVLGSDRRTAPTDAVPPVLASLVDARDTVVFDHPVPTSGVPLHLDDGVLGAGRLDVVVLVGQDVLGVAAALTLVPALVAGLPAARFHLVLRDRLRARVAPVEVARLLDLPVRARVPTDRGLAGAVDRGLGPVPSRWSSLGRAVRRIARSVADG